MKKRKKWIKRAVRMARTGYSTAELRAFILVLRDLRIIDDDLTAEMNTAFHREIAKLYAIDADLIKKNSKEQST